MYNFTSKWYSSQKTACRSDMRFLRYKALKSVMGPGRAGPDREYSDFALNPRPDTVFRHLRPDRGGGGVVRPPLGVSKRSVVELCGKVQRIALAEYSRLVVLFLAVGHYLTQLWQVRSQFFGNYNIFQVHESVSPKLLIVAA